MSNPEATITQQLPGKQSTYLPALTGIRTVAAYMVFLHHFNPFKSYYNAPGTLGGWAYNICNELHIGVTLFFVLSGFLITLRYQGKAELSRAWFSKYAMNRFARIYPMYIFFTLLTFLAMTVSPVYDFMGQYVEFSSASKVVVLLLNLTLLKSFFVNLKFTGIAQSWSLTVEECFYFSVPLVLIAPLLKIPKAALYLVFCLSIGLVAVAIGSHINFFGFFENLNFLFCYTFFGRCFEFIAGMLLAQVIKKNYLPSFKHYTLVGIAGIVALIVVMAAIRGSYAISTLTTSDTSKITTSGVFINNVILPLAICSLYFGLIREQSILRRLLETKLFELLGKSSYIFYLIHIGVIQIFIYNYFTTNKLFLFVTINLLSIVFFKLMEEPIHARLKK